VVFLEEDVMAAPTLEQPVRSEEPPSPGLSERFRQFALRVTPPTTATLLGVLMMTLLGSLLIIGTAPGGLDFYDRFSITSGAYGLLISGAFGSLQNFANTLDRMTPLILAAFSVAIAFRAGLFNIGASGQMTMGGMLAIVVGIKYASAPAWVLAPSALLAGLVGGAIWGAIVGVLKAWRGAHEVVTTIMLNFVAFSISTYMVDCTGNCIPLVGNIKDPAQANKTLQMGKGAALPLLSHLINQIHPGTIADEGLYRANVGLLIALGSVVVYWFLMQRTTLGYEIRAVGQSQKAARYAGINVRRNISITMTIVGAFAGVGGALIVMGPDLLQTVNDQTFKLDTTGFDAISVSLLGLNGAVGILLAGLFFAALLFGSTTMETYSGLLTPAPVHHELIQFAFQAVVLFLIAGQVIPQFRTALSRLLVRLMAGFRSGLQHIPMLVLILLTLLDAVALVALVGYVFDSLISLSSVVSPSPDITTSQAIANADVTTPFDLLLTFYIAGILLVLAFVGIRYIGVRRKESERAAHLVEAFATPAILTRSGALAPPPEAEPETSDDDSLHSTL
jgi:ABC-type uncharacterized transport system permease subunit